MISVDTTGWWVVCIEDSKKCGWSKSERGAKVIATRKNTHTEYLKQQGIYGEDQLRTYTVVKEK